MIKELNQIILSRAAKLRYTVSSLAPSTELALFNSTSLVVWDGASDNTIFDDAKVNYAFRALHDKLHLETGIGFTPQEEIELGRIQASQFDGVIAEIVFSEVAEQARHYLNTGDFVIDQRQFTLNYLIRKGIKL